MRTLERLDLMVIWKLEIDSIPHRNHKIRYWKVSPELQCVIDTITRKIWRRQNVLFATTLQLLRYLALIIRAQYKRVWESIISVKPVRFVWKSSEEVGNDVLERECVLSKYIDKHVTAVETSYWLLWTQEGIVRSSKSLWWASTPCVVGNERYYFWWVGLALPTPTGWFSSPCQRSSSRYALRSSAPGARFFARPYLPVHSAIRYWPSTYSKTNGSRGLKLEEITEQGQDNSCDSQRQESGRHEWCTQEPGSYGAYYRAWAHPITQQAIP